MGRKGKTPLELLYTHVSGIYLELDLRVDTSSFRMYRPWSLDSAVTFSAGPQFRAVPNEHKKCQES